MTYCCKCCKDVKPNKALGHILYPASPAVWKKVFLVCPVCGSHAADLPGATIPTAELRLARQMIHSVIDPIWASGIVSRSELYALLSQRLGYEYHTSQVRTMDEAERIYELAHRIRDERRTAT